MSINFIDLRIDLIDSKISLIDGVVLSRERTFEPMGPEISSRRTSRWSALRSRARIFERTSPGID